MNFNITRFGNLIKRDFITHKKALFYAMVSTIGFLVFIILFARITGSEDFRHASFWKPVYLGFLFVLGLSFTSVIFREFKTPAGRVQFLSLPASNLEKWASRWLYSLFLFPMFIVLSVWITSSMVVSGESNLWDHFHGDELFYISLGFVLLHASMFIYAIWFNNLVAFKGTIFGLVATLAFAGIMAGLFWLIFNDLFEGSFRAGPSEYVSMNAEGQAFFKHKVQPVGEFLIKFFVAPYLWVVSYFKMKEKEA